MHELNTNRLSCPHTHKAPLVLDNGELAGQFLSKHFEKCSPCHEKIESLKVERSILLKEVPFVSAPKVVREVFANESNEVILKVKRRIRALKMKRFNEVTLGIRSFSLDIRKALLSRECILALVLVLAVSSVLKFS